MRAHLVPAPQARLHHRLSHQFPGLCAEPHGPLGRVVLALFPLVPWPRARRARLDALDPRRPAPRRHRPDPSLGPRRRRGPVQARGRGASRLCRSAAPDPAPCRARRGREEYRGVPQSRHAGQQGDRRRRARARGAFRAAIPEAHFLGLLHGETLASAYRGADALVFPEPHRYLWPCHDRGRWRAAHRWRPIR